MSENGSRSSSRHKKHKKEKKHKRKRDDDSDLDELFSGSKDPMLEPFGDEAEREMRKKLEKRLRSAPKIDRPTRNLVPGSSKRGAQSTVNLKHNIPEVGDYDDYREFYDEYRDRPYYYNRNWKGSREYDDGYEPNQHKQRDNRIQTAYRKPEEKRLPRSAAHERNWDKYRPKTPPPPEPRRSKSQSGYERDQPFYDQGDPYARKSRREVSQVPRDPRNRREVSQVPRGGREVSQVSRDRDRSRSRAPPAKKAREGYTGYDYQRGRSRSPDRPPKTIERQPSPPRQMPEHLRWLHDRWSKYDRNFFTGDKPLNRAQREELRPGRGPSDKERKQYNLDMDEYRKNRDRGGSSGGNMEPLGSGRKFSESRAPSAKSQYAAPYYKFRKGGEYHWNPGRMYTFKEFLMSRADDIEDQEVAVRQYNEYKLQFRQQALAEFFKAHSEDEWFLEKYHPIMKQKKDERMKKQVQKRLDTFMSMLVRGWMEIGLDLPDSRKLRKMMDAAIVFLEGGDEGDVAHLNDLEYVLEEKKEQTYDADIKTEKEDMDLLEPISDDDEEDKKDIKKEEIEGAAPGEKGRTKEEQQIDEIEEFGPSNTQLEAMQHAKDYSLFVSEKLKEELAEVDLSDLPDTIETKALKMQHKKTEKGTVFVTQVVNARALEEMNLHKVCSLMIRNVPSSVTRVEMEEMCSEAHGGFLRLYFTEPDPRQNYFRQVIASFWSNANVPRILWKIRGTRLRGVPLVILEFREFKKRIGLTDGLAADKSVVLRDIQLTKSLIEYLDKKNELWGQTADDGGQGPSEAAPGGLLASIISGEQPAEDQDPDAEPPKLNPLLINLDECLAFHLHELMESGQADPTALLKPKVGLVDRDDNLTRVLDRLILYLRIVHAVDYYGCHHYEHEDDEPRRIGMITIRGSPSRKANPKSLAAYIQQFEERLKCLLPQERRLAEEHIELLGKRDADAEVEKFLANNIISVSEGLSKCCLCYKRFTTLEFAQLHLKEKHKDKIEEVKWVVVTFNNYLADPARPCNTDFSTGSAV